MKKFKILFLFAFIFLIPNMFEVNAKTETPVDNADYLTYQENIMASGKLIRDFKDKEIEEALSLDQRVLTNGFVINMVNQNVECSYIAYVQECLENASTTNININVNVTVETNNKVTFTSSGSISLSTGKTLKALKSEAAAKASLEYTTSTYKSVKETRTTTLTVEANSQYMVVVKGNLRISNGVVKLYLSGMKYLYGLFEFVTLESQYTSIEKRSL